MFIQIYLRVFPSVACTRLIISSLGFLGDLKMKTNSA